MQHKHAAQAWWAQFWALKPLNCKVDEPTVNCNACFGPCERLTGYHLCKEMPGTACPVCHHYDEQHQAGHEVQVGMTAPLQGGHPAVHAVHATRERGVPQDQSGSARRLRCKELWHACGVSARLHLALCMLEIQQVHIYIYTHIHRHHTQTHTHVHAPEA